MGSQYITPASGFPLQADSSPCCSLSSPASPPPVHPLPTAYLQPVFPRNAWCGRSAPSSHICQQKKQLHSPEVRGMREGGKLRKMLPSDLCHPGTHLFIHFSTGSQGPAEGMLGGPDAHSLEGAPSRAGVQGTKAGDSKVPKIAPKRPEAPGTHGPLRMPGAGEGGNPDRQSL